MSFPMTFAILIAILVSILVNIAISITSMITSVLSSSDLNLSKKNARKPGDTSSSTLLRLLYELRLEVYSYVWGDHRRVSIERFKGPTGAVRTPMRYKLTYRELCHRDRRTKEIIEDEMILNASPSFPMKLLLLCRSIHDEFSFLLYSRTQFVFNTTKSLRQFLVMTSPTAKSVVSHIELNLFRYGVPRNPEFMLWRRKSENAWLKVRNRAKNDLKSLKVLHWNVFLSPNCWNTYWAGRYSYSVLPFLENDGSLDLVNAIIHMNSPYGDFRINQKLKKAGDVVEEKKKNRNSQRHGDKASSSITDARLTIAFDTWCEMPV